MKTSTYAIVMTATALLFMGTTAGAIHSMVQTGKNAIGLLDECAKQNNVYACRYQAVPTEMPRVVVREAAILPPPSYN